MKKLIQFVVLTTILAMSIKPVMAKKPTHRPLTSHHQKAKNLQQYISKLCKRSCVDAKHLNKTVKLASMRYKVPRSLILAVLKVESRFKTTALSDGNYGLMQVNLSSHRRRVGSSNLFDVDTNIDIGSSVLSKCLANSRNNIMEALECYKGGDNPEYKREVKKAMLVVASLTN